MHFLRAAFFGTLCLIACSKSALAVEVVESAIPDGNGRVYVLYTRYESPEAEAKSDVVVKRFLAGGEIDQTYGAPFKGISLKNLLAGNDKLGSHLSGADLVIIHNQENHRHSILLLGNSNFGQALSVPFLAKITSERQLDHLFGEALHVPTLPGMVIGAGFQTDVVFPKHYGRGLRLGLGPRGDLRVLTRSVHADDTTKPRRYVVTNKFDTSGFSSAELNRYYKGDGSSFNTLSEAKIDRGTDSLSINSFGMGPKSRIFFSGSFLEKTNRRLIVFVLRYTLYKETGDHATYEHARTPGSVLLPVAEDEDVPNFITAVQPFSKELFVIRPSASDPTALQAQAFHLRSGVAMSGPIEIPLDSNSRIFARPSG